MCRAEIVQKFISPKSAVPTIERQLPIQIWKESLGMEKKLEIDWFMFKKICIQLAYRWKESVLEFINIKFFIVQQTNFDLKVIYMK